jgi:hypothetical protein
MNALKVPVVCLMIKKNALAIGLALILSCIAACTAVAQSSGGETNTIQLPGCIKQLTYFGERADWSHDGKKVVFIEKTYGDAYEIEVATGKIRPIMSHFYHGGFTRALYLSNGDVLLCGATSFDAGNPHVNRTQKAEMWILDKGYKTPPTPLGVKCYEGPAVSRRHLKIAWTVVHEQYPDKMAEGEGQIWMADIVYKNGVPSLQNQNIILDHPKSKYNFTKIETQNFIAPLEKELTFQCYSAQGTETMKLDIESKKVVNVSNLPGEFTEPEGISPDGKFTLVESDHHVKKGVQYIDIYKLQLDGSGKLERLTYFNDDKVYKASNPVISDDGKFMAFQIARVGAPPGVGNGIFIYDLEKAKLYPKKANNKSVWK